MRQNIAKLILISLFSASSCFLLVAQSVAATYYVAKTGTDSNSCSQAQSQTSAKVTIQAGVNCAIAAGSVVLVKAGTYVERVGNWPASGATGSPIIVRANPGDTVVWRSSVTDPNSHAGAVEIFNRSYIRIEGFRFDGSATKSTLRVVNSGSQDTSPVQGIEIINNTFVNNGNNGIATSGAFSRVINFDKVGRGSSYTGPPVNLISRNSFDSNFGTSILLYLSSDTRVTDNVSTRHKSSQNASNGSQFQTSFVLFTNDGRRNVFERNQISTMVKDSYVTNTYEASGFRLDSGGTDSVVRDNVIRDIDTLLQGRSFAIHNEARCHRNTFQRNLIYNIGEGAIRLGSEGTTAPSGVQIISNTVYNVMRAGIALVNAASTTVKNNIVMKCGSSEIWTSDNTVNNGGHVFKDNLYYNSSRLQVGYWNSTGGPSSYNTANLGLPSWNSASKETGSLSANPLFVNVSTGDFHLQSTSPAKGTADDGSDLGAYSASASSLAPSAPVGLVIH